MFSEIIVPVDIEHIDQARKALMAARLNLAKNGRIKLVHVLAEIPAFVAAQVDKRIFDSAREEVRRLLDELKQSENMPDNTEIIIETGRTYRKILEHIGNPESQAIVMAAHSPRISDVFLGSVAAQVVRHAPCSVFILRNTVG